MRTLIWKYLHFGYYEEPISLEDYYSIIHEAKNHPWLNYNNVIALIEILDKNRESVTAWINQASLSQLRESRKIWAKFYIVVKTWISELLLKRKLGDHSDVRKKYEEETPLYELLMEFDKNGIELSTFAKCWEKTQIEISEYLTGIGHDPRDYWFKSLN